MEKISKMTKGQETCIFCGMVSKSASALEIHLVRHTQEKPYFCKQCDACFGYLTSLKDHELTHSGVRYMCSKCKKIFNVRTSYACHRKLCYGDNPALYKPPVVLTKAKKCKTGDGEGEEEDETEDPVPETVEVDEELFTEELPVWDFNSPFEDLPKIPQCDESQPITLVNLPPNDPWAVGVAGFYPPRLRTIHELPEHPRTLFLKVGNEIKMPLLGLEEMQFLIYTSNNYERNLAGVGQGEVPKRRPNASPSKRPEKTSPKIVSRASVKPKLKKRGRPIKVNPEQVKRLMTGDRRKRNHECPACGKRFFYKCQVIAHMVVHTGDKPFRCGVCNARFSRNGNLRQHMRNVHKVKVAETSPPEDVPIEPITVKVEEEPTDACS